MRFPYNFCPVCGSRLGEVESGGALRPGCKCGFVHYSNPAPAAAAVVLREGRMLWVRRAHDPFRGLWSLPSGFLEWDEDIRDCAVRETLEETGLEVELGDCLCTLSGFDDPRTQALLAVFWARVTGGEERAGDDACETRWFSVDAPPEGIAWEIHREVARRVKAHAESGRLPA